MRGAYYNLDINTDKLFWRIEDTHRSYNEGIRYFLENCKSTDQLLCATHNYDSNEIAKTHIHQGKNNVSIGHLMGMSDYLSEELADEGIRFINIYPMENIKILFPYFTRSLYENYPILGHML